MTINNTPSSQDGAYASEPRVYELGYHILSTVDEGNIEEERNALVAIITKYNGTIISEEMPGLINLAYDMDKIIDNKRQSFSQAYFGWIKFDLSPDDIVAFEKEIDAIPSLLRFLLIKTVRENTIVSETPYKFAKSGKKAGELEEEEELEGNDIERPLADEAPKGEEENLSEENESVQEEFVEEESPVEADDLTKIEGIGPKIAEIFAKAGIRTFEDLSSSKVGDLRDILAEHKLSSHDPKTWSKQATLAKHGKWDELKTLQDELNGGKE